MDDLKTKQAIKDIINRVSVPGPLDDFTLKTMDKIRQLPVLAIDEVEVKENLKDRLMMIVFVISGLFTAGWFLYPFITSYFQTGIDPQYISMLGKLSESLNSIFASFKVSSLTIAVIGAVLLIIAIDISIRKISSSRRNYILL